MKTLCIDLRLLNSGGIGRYIRNFLPFLEKEFKLVALTNNFNLKYKQIYFNAPIYSIKEQILYPVKIPNSDIFWSPHYNIPILPIKAKKRIVTIHDVYHLAFYQTLKWHQKLYAKFFLKKAIELSDVILTVSNFSKKEIIKYLKPDKEIYVVYNGLNQEWLNVEPLPLEKRENYILFVGNVKPHKNLVRALQAFTLIKDKSLKFKIVGKKEGFITGDDKVKKLASQLGNRVEFTGVVSEKELKELYRRARLFIYPSLYEGFGLPPLEAMACGTPVIVSNVASLPEVCGDAAYYVNPYDVDDIAKGMLTVLNNKQLQQSLILKGFQRVKLFSIERSAQKLINIFKEVL